MLKLMVQYSTVMEKYIITFWKNMVALKMLWIMILKTRPHSAISVPALDLNYLLLFASIMAQ